MINNFSEQGMNIIAHHYFKTRINDRSLLVDNLNHVRYMSSTISSGSNAFAYQQTRTIAKENMLQSSQLAGAPDQKQQQQGGVGNGPTGNQSITSQGTFIIRGEGDLNNILKNNESGQRIDMRTSTMSPEVISALQRGEPVEVKLQQMAPERVNLLTPLIASAMQIFGGFGGAAYNDKLSEAITGKGGDDKGSLGKAADFVSRHGNSFSMNPFGGGEHIDVVAQFRVLNKDADKTNTPPATPVTPPQTPPKPKPPTDLKTDIPEPPVPVKPKKTKIAEVSPGEKALESQSPRMTKDGHKLAPYFVSDVFRDQAQTYIADKQTFASRLDDFHTAKTEFKNQGLNDEQIAQRLGFKDSKAMNTFLAKADNFVKQIPGPNASANDVAKFETFLKDGNNSVESKKPLNNNDIGHFVLGASPLKTTSAPTQPFNVDLKPDSQPTDTSQPVKKVDVASVGVSDVKTPDLTGTKVGRFEGIFDNSIISTTSDIKITGALKPQSHFDSQEEALFAAQNETAKNGDPKSGKAFVVLKNPQSGFDVYSVKAELPETFFQSSKEDPLSKTRQVEGYSVSSVTTQDIDPKIKDKIAYMVTADSETFASPAVHNNPFSGNAFNNQVPGQYKPVGLKLAELDRMLGDKDLKITSYQGKFPSKEQAQAKAAELAKGNKQDAVVLKQGSEFFVYTTSQIMEKGDKNKIQDFVADSFKGFEVDSFAASNPNEGGKVQIIGKTSDGVFNTVSAPPSVTASATTPNVGKTVDSLMTDAQAKVKRVSEINNAISQGNSTPEQLKSFSDELTGISTDLGKIKDDLSKLKDGIHDSKIQTLTTQISSVQGNASAIQSNISSINESGKNTITTLNDVGGNLDKISEALGKFQGATVLAPDGKDKVIGALSQVEKTLSGQLESASVPKEKVSALMTALHNNDKGAIQSISKEIDGIISTSSLPKDAKSKLKADTENLTKVWGDAQTLFKKTDDSKVEPPKEGVSKLHEGTNGILYSDPNNIALSKKFTGDMLNNGVVTPEEQRRGMILLSFGNELKGNHQIAAGLMDPKLSDTEFSANLQKAIGRPFNASEQSLVKEKNPDKIVAHLKGSKETAAFMERGPLLGVNLSSLKPDQLKFMGMEMVLRHKNGPEGKPITEVMDSLIGPQHITSLQEAFIARAASLADTAQIFNGQAPFDKVINSDDWSKLSASTGMSVDDLKKLVTQEGSIDDLSKARLDQVILSLNNSSGEVNGKKLDRAALETNVDSLSDAKLASTKVSDLSTPIVQAMMDSLPDDKKAAFSKLLKDNPNMTLSDFIKLDGVKAVRTEALQGVKKNLNEVNNAIHDNNSALRLDLQPELSQLSREIGVLTKSIDDAIKPGETTDNSAASTKFMTDFTSSLQSIENVLKQDPNATINGKPALDVLKDLQSKFSKFTGDFPIDGATKESINKRLSTLIQQASNPPKPVETDPGTGTGDPTKPELSYQDALDKSLDELNAIKDNASATVKLPDGKEVNVVTYINDLEAKYKTHLMSGEKLDAKKVEETSNKFSQLYTTFKNVNGLGKYDEVRDGFALAAEASNNADAALAIEGKKGSTTLNPVGKDFSPKSDDYRALTKSMINGLPPSGLKNLLTKEPPDGLMGKDNKVSGQDLYKIITAKFTDFSDDMAKQFFAISERLLKQSDNGDDKLRNIDLTGLYSSYNTTGKEVQQGMEKVIKYIAENKPESVLPPNPLPSSMPLSTARKQKPDEMGLMAQPEEIQKPQVLAPKAGELTISGSNKSPVPKEEAPPIKEEAPEQETEETPVIPVTKSETPKTPTVTKVDVAPKKKAVSSTDAEAEAKAAKMKEEAAKKAKEKEVAASKPKPIEVTYNDPQAQKIDYTKFADLNNQTFLV